MATVYFREWGNDNNSGSSVKNAKKTYYVAGTLQSMQGYFNLQDTSGAYMYITSPYLGNLILDGSFKSYLGYARDLTNTVVQNYSAYTPGPYGGSMILYNCVLRKINNIIRSETYATDQTKTVFDQISYMQLRLFRPVYCTVHRSAVVTQCSHHTSYRGNANNTIFSDCVINISSDPIGIAKNYFQFCLFVNTRFKFNGEATIEYPIGSSDLEKLGNLRDRMSIAYGGSPDDYLIGCRYYSGSYNDIFTDADKGDFNLVPNCIAANMSYNGDYIGARPEGTIEKITDFTNLVNIDSSGNILDQNIDASADTDINDIGYIRKILNIGVGGQRAKRNGQSVNTESDLGAPISAGSSVMTAGKVYQCQDNTISIDNALSTSLIPFENYYAIDEGSGVGLGFTGSGVMREVLIDSYPEKLQFKFSKTDPTLASATTITCFVKDGYVMVNVDGSGEPTHGDADVGYDAGTASILSTRYWKAFPLIKAFNITSGRP